ncbi:MAG: DUF1997 domain-containing protein [Anaerolineales bacterium]|nr:DUF1997 domain-containing protein [Anaerolineales bacterium]
MIEISGTIQRAFLFPAAADMALAYYGNMARILPLLPHISVVQEYSSTQFRTHYQTVELGAYTVNVFCDLESEVDHGEMVIHVRPGQFAEPTAASTTLTSSTAYGLFSMLARFFPLEGQTRIEYRLGLQARLPRPAGLRLMPKRVLNGVGQGITNGRLREIADGFITRSLEDFPHWLTQQPTIPAP